MNKKTKLILMISSFCFVFATCMFSVFAAKNFGFNMAGTIDFIAPGVEATVSNATLLGITAKDGSGQMQGFIVERDDTEEQIAAKAGVQSWKNLGLLFADDSKGNATISFTITNNSSKTTENIMVNLSTSTTESSPIQATPSADFCIAPGVSHTFTINISVADIKTTVLNSGFNLTIALNRLTPSEVLSVTEQQENGFNFTTNAETESTEAYASLTTYTGSATAVEIPSVVKDANDILYTVTEIASGTSVSNSAFYSVRSTLTTITFSSTLTKIGDYAFSNCNSLGGNLVIPNGVITIGNCAFMSSGTSRIDTTLTIGGSVTTIGAAAFRDCRRLTGDLIIPNSVTTIGSGAFANCNSLSGELKLSNKLTTINNSTFLACIFSGDLIIPTGVTTIKENAFKSTPFKNGILSIPSSVISIAEDALPNGSRLVGIEVDSGNNNYYSKNNCLISKQDKVLILGCKNSVIPQEEGILKIGNYAFSGCTGLTGNLVIPNTVTEIGTSAFSGCTGLNGVLTIGSGITTIDSSAFRSCTGLTSITINATNPPTLGAIVFDSTGSGSIYVPAESVDAYKAATNWSTYADRITAIV